MKYQTLFTLSSIMDVINDKDFDSALDHLNKDFHFLSTNRKDVNSFQSNDQRVKERHLRETLQSRHGPTAEIHDQFYRDHKLLLVLFRVLAVMPIERSSPGRITFSWKSRASIYAFFFYTFATVIVVIVGLERIKILGETKKFDDTIYGILFIIFLIPHFWIPFVGWGVASEVARYKTSWGAFQLCGTSTVEELKSHQKISQDALGRLANITLALYGTMSSVIDHGFQFSFKEIGLIVDTVYCSILLFVFCDCSHSSTLQVAQGVQDTLLTINLLVVDRPTQKEIDIFTQAIEMNPAIVSLRGYAEVNRELLTSSIATIAIYLIVLIQFKLSLVQQQSRN
ncbi:CLUMA_CG017953, isoform A [Clunio marinus]|uniref:Gustatory receptor n=1 Tax=Clunio marinus TaxID=568069 RepID=A0A1J1J0G1_9DIPT|nr:CLUMA_CG017953, isoform A [Clunio marinus]